MKKSELRQIIKEEIQKNSLSIKKHLTENKLIEGDIKNDTNLLLQDLKDKEIITKGDISSTGYGARGKNKILAYTNNLKFNDFDKLIKNNYKQSGNTSLSSDVFYFPKGKLHFYYYSNGNGKFSILTRRKNYKS